MGSGFTLRLGLPVAVGGADLEGEVCREACCPAVYAPAHELLGGAVDLVAADAGFLKHVGEQDPGPPTSFETQESVMSASRAGSESKSL
jgi:hypothetical protein